MYSFVFYKFDPNGSLTAKVVSINAVAIANEARLRGVGYTELVGMLSEVFSRAKADFS